MINRKNNTGETIDTSSLSTDPEVLREQQRVLEAASAYESTTAVLRSQRRIEQGRITFRWVLLAVLVVVLANVFFAYHDVFRTKPHVMPHVGIVEIRGRIATDENASADRVIAGIREAMQQRETLKALVIRINSPGGSPVEAQRIYNEILRQRHLHPTIPIHSWIGDVGASAAYYAAAATQTIYASPSALIGNIGVISSGFGFSGLLEHVGVERRTISTGDNKAFLDPFAPVVPSQVAAWQDVLDDIHHQFIEDVKRGRVGFLDNRGPEDEVFSGQVWSGNQAKGIGLVDASLQFEEALLSIFPQEDGSAPLTVDYTATQGLLDRFAKTLSASLVDSLAGTLLGASNSFQNVGQ